MKPSSDSNSCDTQLSNSLTSRTRPPAELPTTNKPQPPAELPTPNKPQPPTKLPTVNDIQPHVGLPTANHPSPRTELPTSFQHSPPAELTTPYQPHQPPQCTTANQHPEIFSKSSTLSNTSRPPISSPVSASASNLTTSSFFSEQSLMDEIESDLLRFYLEI